jgi:hypothetical protein
VANKKALFVTLVDRVSRFEAYTEASFLPNLMDSLWLRVAQISETRDISIFVLMTTTTTMTQPITLPLAVHACRG